MKIIGTDNHARESVADTLVAENITSKMFADVMVEALNKKFGSGEGPGTYFMVVDDDRRLSRGMEDLI